LPIAKPFNEKALGEGTFAGGDGYSASIVRRSSGGEFGVEEREEEAIESEEAVKP